MDRSDVAGLISDYIVGGKETFSTIKGIKEDGGRHNFLVVMYSGRRGGPH